MLRDDLLRLVHPAPAELPWFQVISWVCDPCEYATDSLFKTPFVDLYDKLLNHSIARMGAGDILTFPGKRFDGRFKGEQKSTTALFKEVLSGDYIVQGFRNADIRDALFGPTDTNAKRRLSARITQLFNKLHARGLIAKIPRSLQSQRIIICCIDQQPVGFNMTITRWLP